METANLRAFIEVAQTGSVQGAARKLGLSRSALRRALDALEAEVGAPLFHRDPSGVRLTPAGCVALERGKVLIDSARDFLEEARHADRDVVGTIRVVEPVGLPLAMHVSAILAVHAAMPRQRIVIRHEEDPVSLMHEPFELMLHEGPAPDRNAWFSRVIVRVNLRLVASRGYLAEHGTPKSAADLVGHKALGWNRPGHPAGEWPLLAGGVVRCAPWLCSSDPHLLASVAAQGGGILLAPRMPFFDDGTEDGLQTLLTDEIGCELVFRVTTPFPHSADPRTRETLTVLLAQLEGLPAD